MSATLEPVSAHEIAARLGVKVSTVHQWRFRGILPPADYTLGVGHVWWWSTIAEWAKTTGRL